MKVKYRNFTPHPLHVVREDCPDIVEADERDGYLKYLVPAEVASPKEAPRVEVDEINETLTESEDFSIALVETQNGETVRLPDPKEGTLFIVSKITLDGSSRRDLVCIYDAVRNAKGWTMGCRKFSHPRRT